MMFFNSSMPRSGSELLQVVLHQNPAIYASSTSPLLEYQFGARSNYELAEVQSQDPSLMQAAFSSMCRGMARSYYGAITDRPHICDKNRGWMHYFEWVSQWNPQPKMICMVRDLRNVFASFERIFRENRHRPVGPDNPQQLQSMTVMDRVNHWSETQPLGLALLRLADAFQRGVSDQICFVRYEDLCEHPEATIGRIYDYLGLPAFSHDFQNVVKKVHENDALFGPYGQHSVKSSIHPVMPKAWLSVLNEDIANHITARHSWFQNCFGYGS